jgi:hypothetical protein
MFVDTQVVGALLDQLDAFGGLVVEHSECAKGPDPPRRPSTGTPFANSVLVLDSAYLSGGINDLPHELGHALFNLADEYVGEVYGFDGRIDLSSWPSCAGDVEEADEWWGDVEGAVDPMVSIWVAEMEDAGFAVPNREAVASLVEVGVVDGGCYGVPGSVRATVDSLMNTSIPVLGVVNRRWSEQILDLWAGAPRS